MYNAYVRTEINANVFTPLSIQFENLTLCQLRCSDLILTRHVPTSTTPNRKMVRRMVIPCTCSIRGQYQIWHRRVSAIIA